MLIRKFLILLFIVAISGCSIFKPATKTTGANIYINGIDIPGGKTELSIEKEGFSIEFSVFPYSASEKQRHAAQIAATADASNLKYFEEGAIDRLNPFLSDLGTGIATERYKGYDCMYIRDSGHHYIYYKSDRDKRAELVKKARNGKVRLRWDVNCFYTEDRRVKIKDSDIDTIYLMIFIDENLNNKIDTNEYSLITLNFENSFKDAKDGS
ncbi:MAG: hypothetical protein R6T91_02170 [Bacteroidales bacterium]